MEYNIIPLGSILQEDNLHGAFTKQLKNLKPHQTFTRATQFGGKSGERRRDGMYRYFAAGGGDQRSDYRADQRVD